MNCIGKEKFGLSLKQYLKGMIEELKNFGENLDSQFPQLAAKWLFMVDPGSKSIEETKGQKIL